MKNKILAIAMCTVLIASMLIIPTSAVNEEFYILPYYVTEPSDNETIYNSGIVIGTNLEGDSCSAISVYQEGLGTEMSFFFVKEDSLNYYYLVWVGEQNCVSRGVKRHQYSDGTYTYSAWNGTYMFNTDNTTGLHYTSYYDAASMQDQYKFSTNGQYPVFSTIREGLDAYSGYVTAPGAELNYSLPAGNAIWIELDNLVGAELFATMPQASYIFGGSDPFYGANQEYLFTDSLPSPGPLNLNGTRIVWQKDTSQGTAITGQTKRAYYDFMGPYPNSRYLVIVNPAYYGDTANGPYEFLNNPPVQIHAIGTRSVHVYSLYSSVTGNTSGGFSVGTEITGSEWIGPVDPITGQPSFETTPESQPNPTSGGGNLPTEGKSINDWLENIAESISGFFNGAIGAINTLVSAISSFTGTLQSLYMWLPSPVYGLLTSAIMLAITIGVIKVFI